MAQIPKRVLVKWLIDKSSLKPSDNIEEIVDEIIWSVYVKQVVKEIL